MTGRYAFISSMNLDTDVDDDTWHSIENSELSDQASIQSISLLDNCPHINLSSYVYNPLPTSFLPDEIKTICLIADEQYFEGDLAIMKSQEVLLEHAKAYPTCVEITWRICRAALYIRTYNHLMKTSFASIILAALEFAKHGIELLEHADSPYNLEGDKELVEEIKVTCLAPMYKWAGGIFGCSAEVMSSISDKINSAHISYDYYLKAIEHDPNDYYMYYSVARYHWEVWKLPSLLKRSANWISTRQFNSTISDVLEWLELVLDHYPYEDPYINLPSDVLVLLAQSHQANNDLLTAKKYAIEAETQLDHNIISNSKVQAMIQDEISTLLKNL